MPNRLYEYRCPGCGGVTEDLRPVTQRDDDGPPCEHCPDPGPTTYVVSASRRQNYNLKGRWKSRNTNIKEV